MRHKYTCKMIGRIIPFNSKVLDIGIGEGYWSQLEGKYDVVGVNLYASPLVDTVLNVEKDSLIDVLGEKFQFITMFDVLEHLENPVCALKNILNVLDKNGLFIGSTPNRFDPYLFVGGQIHRDHNYIFDKLTIQHLLRNCGFTPIDVKSRVFPIKLSRKIFISVDVSKLIPAGRVLFWVATHHSK